MAKIHVTDREGGKHDLNVQEGLTLMEPLRELADGIEALCGGMCSCSTCHVFVESPWFEKLPKARSDEMELLQGTECFRASQSRLACQVKVTPDLDGMVLTVAPPE
jgi:2Fe-2S ferredoxin